MVNQPEAAREERFMREAIRLSKRSLTRKEGGPFGAVIVQADRIVARGWNQVVSAHDPTAHAEVMAIRKACRRLERCHLEDCVIYTSCEPCPMCLSTIYWARLSRIVWGSTRHDAARIGFQDESLYRELCLPAAKRRMPFQSALREEARHVMKEWRRMEDRTLY